MPKDNWDRAATFRLEDDRSTPQPQPPPQSHTENNYKFWHAHRPHVHNISFSLLKLSGLESISRLLTQYLKIPFNSITFIYIFPSRLIMDLQDQRLHLSSPDESTPRKVQLLHISFTLSEKKKRKKEPVKRTGKCVIFINVSSDTLKSMQIHTIYFTPYKSKHPDALQS